MQVRFIIPESFSIILPLLQIRVLLSWEKAIENNFIESTSLTQYINFPFHCNCQKSLKTWQDKCFHDGDQSGKEGGARGGGRGHTSSAKIFFHLIVVFFLVKLKEWIPAYETNKPLHLGIWILVRHLFRRRVFATGDESVRVRRVYHQNRPMFGNRADTLLFVKKGECDDGEDDDES